MANINSITGSSNSYTSNIYGNKNILSGLASGMDTESMIENSISGYKTKISSLQQSQTKTQWKQDAYRDIIDQMAALSTKYTSYTSPTNLFSSKFFTSAVTTTTEGTNASKISATGKSSSDIQINAVTQLATAAQYSISAGSLGAIQKTLSTTGDSVQLDGNIAVNRLSGTLTMTYGTQKFDIDFDDLEDYSTDEYANKDADGNVIETSASERLANAIKSKMADIDITTRSGVKKASEVINVSGANNQISFSEASGGEGNEVFISKTTGSIANVLGIETGTLTDKNGRSFSVSSSLEFTKQQDIGSYLSNKTIDVRVDGISKSISLGDLTNLDENETVADRLTSNLTNNLKDVFGDRVTFALNQTGQDSNGNALYSLDFGVKDGSNSTISVTSEVGGRLGFGDGLSNYVNTSTKLGSLVDNSWFTRDNALKAVGAAHSDDGGKTYYDSQNNKVMNVDGTYYRVNDNNELLYGMEINGKTVGAFTKDSTLESVMTSINSSKEAGVNVSYSSLTNKFLFTAKETGSAGKIEFGEGLAANLFVPGGSNNPKLLDLAGVGSSGDPDNPAPPLTVGIGNSNMRLRGLDENSTLKDLVDAINTQTSSIRFDYDQTTNSFSNVTARNYDNDLSKINLTINGQSMKLSDLFSDYTAGKDAIFNATINGETMNLTRASNVVSMDGLNVTLRDTFDARDATTGKVNTADAVTFKTSSNADTIVDAIRSFVNDYNEMATSIHSAYTTQPAKNSSNNSYEPLTDDDKAGMSESAIANYESKAKQGLLFADTDLSALYGGLLNVISPGGNARKAMEAIGLTTSYADGVTTLSLDETKLRSALDSNPDSVKDVFTSSSTSKGLMEKLKATLDTYASTSISSPGVLVRKAGSKLSSYSLLNNTFQTQMDNIQTQIEKWQEKMSTKIDYYTRQYTALEKLINSMNSQSSALSSLMGGY